MRSGWAVFIEPIEDPLGQGIVHGQGAVVLAGEVAHGLERASLVGDSFFAIAAIGGTEPKEKFGGAEHVIERPNVM